MSDPYSLLQPLPLAADPALDRTFALETWAALRVSGADAESFLQGQLSADVRAVAPGRAIWASYNSPKGRMLAVMRLQRDADAILVELPPALVEPIAKRLRMFVLRSKVVIEPRAASSIDGDAALRDRRALIDRGIPVIYPETQDRWVAQMANLDLVGGISFDKGCYTGQEVVARLHYLGNLKRRMFRLHGDGEAPAPGAVLRQTGGDGQAVGDIVDACSTPRGFIASAVLQISVSESDRLELDAGLPGRISRPEAYVYPLVAPAQAAGSGGPSAA